MKFVLKLILTILFIPLFLILLVSITVRFQLLAPSFWQNIFENSNTYSKLSVAIIKNLESGTVAEGGKAEDVKILSDLVTPENLKDTIDKNISNVLSYANGKTGEVTVYIPIGKIPKPLLPKNFGAISEQTKLADLFSEFNVSGISQAQIQMISRAGSGSWLVFFITSLVLVVLLFLLYLTIDSGKSLIAPGLALILAGFTASLATMAGTYIRINLIGDLAGKSNMGDTIIGIVAPPVIQGILSVWLLIGLAAIILGIMLFFIKKPYNKGNKPR